MIDKQEKKEIVNKHQKHTTDTGSPEVQVAVYTARIKEISGHLSTNKKDFSALRGLQKLVSMRKKLLSYLNKRNSDSYKKLIQELGIRG
ncbi:MAG: 30S ribosomal protein S15 [Candidatus Melainabacteria bacterium]|jgi:small subunit ribosomal protein S15